MIDDATDLLGKRLDYIEANLAALHDQVDKNNMIGSEKIGACLEAIKELQLIIHGEPRFRLTGMTSQMENMNSLLAAMQVEREALRNQIRGMGLTLKIIGVVGPAGGALLSKVMELLF